MNTNEETPKSELIREWVVAVEDNMRRQDINAGVTLKCIACKEYNPNAVVECRINGCPLWPFRTKALKLE